MTESPYRLRWQRLRKAPASSRSVERLARQVAAAFMDGYLQDGSYDGGLIELLCEMSAHPLPPGRPQPAARALFGLIVERLCDEFEQLPAEVYNRVMAQVVTFCRRQPAGADLDRRLAGFGIQDGGQLIGRLTRLRAKRRTLGAGRPPESIFVLSRITVGADVAVTSVVLQRLADRFPNSDLILAGPAKCAEIFGGWPRLRLAEVAYERKGGLFERLSSWQGVLAVIEAHAPAAGRGRMAVVDPDSRLSQLGLLPLADERDCFYFDSRSAGPATEGHCIGAIANAWMDRVTGRGGFAHPRVWPRAVDLAAADAFCARLRQNGARRLVVVNLGVGGNPRKRIGRRFERALLRRLLRAAGTLVLLDKGLGAGEAAEADALLSELERRGHPVAEATLAAGLAHPMAGGVIGMRLGIGELAALIAHGDEYIGYDSAGQHIAAALGTPCVTVFAGSNSMRFIQRWAALGPGRRRIVHADTLSNPAAVDVQAVIDRVMTARGGR